MIIGTGIDLTEIDRIKKVIERQPAFVHRILTANEKVDYEKLTGYRKVEFIAGRFAAKEAYSKARGTGIGKELSFHDIEIFYDERGKPNIESSLKERVHLSISHSKQYAVAQVIIESLSR
ncbi:holo-ACP synthase [Metabacillus iocasae]|uniref:Holo-[acyl-carrier-protein] synthase n=1 Tax=Priestia iocasae TaxID=2291674 RepID=A0ABS2R2R7_9BACI|nr:holo-ACP synthase [Metabacillus iocasae]MBM7705019.1 holo-[acyl-carrier protein] synthase [Metabacillus iocasae]